MVAYPSRCMDAQLITADHAQVSDGKLTIIGGFWDRSYATPFPRAIALVFTCDWDETGVDHSWRVTLRDLDGRERGVDGSTDGVLRVEGTFHSRRDAELAPGRSVRHRVAANRGSHAFAPGSYAWHVAVDGAERAEWRRTFVVTPPPG